MIYFISMSPRRTAADIASLINARLERLMPVLTPAGIILGFLLPQVFGVFRPLVPWLFAVMTLSGALKLRARELGMALRRPLPALLFFFSAHVLMPLVVLLVTRIIFRDADTISGFILLYAAPTAVSGFIWVSIFRGDNALALALILLDTLAAPLIMPGTVSLLLGTNVSLNMTGMALSLLVMVVLPTIVGVFFNEISKGKIPALCCPCLNPLSKLLMVMVISANTSAAARQIRLGNPSVWIIGGLCVFLNALGFCSAKLIGILGRLKSEKRVTLFFIAGLRNITAATTIAIEYFPEAAALPTILGIVFQQTMAALMGKLLLGKAPAKN